MMPFTRRWLGLALLILLSITSPSGGFCTLKKNVAFVSLRSRRPRKRPEKDSITQLHSTLDERQHANSNPVAQAWNNVNHNMVQNDKRILNELDQLRASFQTLAKAAKSDNNNIEESVPFSPEIPLRTDYLQESQISDPNVEPLVEANHKKEATKSTTTTTPSDPMQIKPTSLEATVDASPTSSKNDRFARADNDGGVPPVANGNVAPTFGSYLDQFGGGGGATKPATYTPGKKSWGPMGGSAGGATTTTSYTDEQNIRSIPIQYGQNDAWKNPTTAVTNHQQESQPKISDPKLKPLAVNNNELLFQDEPTPKDPADEEAVLTKTTSYANEQNNVAPTSGSYRDQFGGGGASKAATYTPAGRKKSWGPMGGSAGGVTTTNSYTNENTIRSIPVRYVQKDAWKNPTTAVTNDYEETMSSAFATSTDEHNIPSRPDQYDQEAPTTADYKNYQKTITSMLEEMNGFCTEIALDSKAQRQPGKVIDITRLQNTNQKVSLVFNKLDKDISVYEQRVQDLKRRNGRTVSAEEWTNLEDQFSRTAQTIRATKQQLEQNLQVMVQQAPAGSDPFSTKLGSGAVESDTITTSYDAQQGGATYGRGGGKGYYERSSSVSSSSPSGPGRFSPAVSSSAVQKFYDPAQAKDDGIILDKLEKVTASNDRAASSQQPTTTETILNVDRPDAATNSAWSPSPPSSGSALQATSSGRQPDSPFQTPASTAGNSYLSGLQAARPADEPFKSTFPSTDFRYDTTKSASVSDDPKDVRSEATESMPYGQPLQESIATGSSLYKATSQTSSVSPFVPTGDAAAWKSRGGTNWTSPSSYMPSTYKVPANDPAGDAAASMSGSGQWPQSSFMPQSSYPSSNANSNGASATQSRKTGTIGSSWASSSATSAASQQTEQVDYAMSSQEVRPNSIMSESPFTDQSSYPSFGSSVPSTPRVQETPSGSSFPPGTTNQQASSSIGKSSSRPIQDLIYDPDNILGIEERRPFSMADLDFAGDDDDEDENEGDYSRLVSFLITGAISVAFPLQLYFSSLPESSTAPTTMPQKEELVDALAQTARDAESLWNNLSDEAKATPYAQDLWKSLSGATKVFQLPDSYLNEQRPSTEGFADSLGLKAREIEDLWNGFSDLVKAASSRAFVKVDLPAASSGLAGTEDSISAVESEVEQAIRADKGTQSTREAQPSSSSPVEQPPFPSLDQNGPAESMSDSPSQYPPPVVKEETKLVPSEAMNEPIAETPEPSAGAPVLLPPSEESSSSLMDLPPPNADQDAFANDLSSADRFSTPSSKVSEEGPVPSFSEAPWLEQKRETQENDSLPSPPALGAPKSLETDVLQPKATTAAAHVATPAMPSTSGEVQPSKAIANNAEDTPSETGMSESQSVESAAKSALLSSEIAPVVDEQARLPDTAKMSNIAKSDAAVLELRSNLMQLNGQLRKIDRETRQNPTDLAGTIETIEAKSSIAKSDVTLLELKSYLRELRGQLDQLDGEAASIETTNAKASITKSDATILELRSNLRLLKEQLEKLDGEAQRNPTDLAAPIETAQAKSSIAKSDAAILELRSSLRQLKEQLKKLNGGVGQKGTDFVAPIETSEASWGAMMSAGHDTRFNPNFGSYIDYDQSIF